MKQYRISSLLRFLDAVSAGSVAFRHHGRTTTCLMFGSQHGLRCMVGGTEFELRPLSTRIVFDRKVWSMNSALLAPVRAAYMALSSHSDMNAMYGKQITLSMPGYDVVGKVRASHFDTPLSYLTGKHYCQMLLTALHPGGCDTCNNRTAGRRCLDDCRHKTAAWEHRE